MTGLTDRDRELLALKYWRRHEQPRDRARHGN
jgi:hypothetical protein